MPYQLHGVLVVSQPVLFFQFAPLVLLYSVTNSLHSAWGISVTLAQEKLCAWAKGTLLLDCPKANTIIVTTRVAVKESKVFFDILGISIFNLNFNQIVHDKPRTQVYWHDTEKHG